MDALRLFDAPVYVYRVEGAAELNLALRHALLRERAYHPGVARSNRGGWHSLPDLAQRQEPHYTGLCRMVLDHMARSLQHMAQQRLLSLPSYRWGLQGWAMVMERGDYTILHDHARADLSAVWYIDAGDDDPRYPESGHLSLVQPGGGASGPLSALLPNHFSLKPATGTLVIFPGHLQHYVHPYQDQTPRISAAFNATLSTGP
jgi:uncharacterized protein (TIGR02466 family)